MEKSDIAVRIEGGLASVDVNRPELGNTLTRDMMLRLAERLAELGRKPEVTVVALRPRGDDFCRGRDRAGASIEGMSAYDRRHKVFGAILAVYSAIAEMPLPVVACVKGRATGFGAALAGACDITLVADDARFSFPEINQGIPPTLAISAVMPNVPAKALAYLIYSADEIDAGRAVALGLASRVIAAADFEREVGAFLDTLAARPRLILETIKRFQRKAGALDAGMVSEYAGTLLALASSAL